MATWDDVRRTALELPETNEQSAGGVFEWRVKDKGFVWERPLRRGDIAALGDEAPRGPILAAHVPDLGVKEALLADTQTSTSPHRTSTATGRSWFAWTGWLSRTSRS